MPPEEDAYISTGAMVSCAGLSACPDHSHARDIISIRSGALLQRADANGRWHQLAVRGLHRLDSPADADAGPLCGCAGPGDDVRGLVISVTMLLGVRAYAPICEGCFPERPAVARVRQRAPRFDLTEADDCKGFDD